MKGVEEQEYDQIGPRDVKEVLILYEIRSTK